MLGLGDVVVPPQLRGAYAGYLEHTIQSYVSTAEECLFRANLDPMLPALQLYLALLLYGRHDWTVPFVHGQRLAAKLPQSVLAPLPDGHYAILQ
jgi:pimeloyl-ACP methyl ester carboxylesterase